MLSLPKFTTISSPDHPVLNPFKGFKKFYSGHYFVTDPSTVFVNYVMSDTLRIPEEKGLLNVKIANYNTDESVEDFYSSDMYYNWKTLNVFLEDNKTKEINYISIYYEYITITNKIYRWTFNFAIDYNTSTIYYTNATQGDKIGFTMIREPDTVDNLSNVYTKQEMNNNFIKLDDKRIQENNIIKGYATEVKFTNGTTYSLTYLDAGTPLVYKLNLDQQLPVFWSDGRPDINYYNPIYPVDIVGGDFNGYRNSFYINPNIIYAGGAERIYDLILTLGHYNTDATSGKIAGYTGVKIYHPQDTYSTTASGSLLMHKPYSRDNIAKSIIAEPITRLINKRHAQAIFDKQVALINNLNYNTVRNYRLSAVISHTDGIGKYTSYNERAITTGFRVVSTGTRTLTTTGVWRYSRVIQYYKNGWRELGQ